MTDRTRADEWINEETWLFFLWHRTEMINYARQVEGISVDAIILDVYNKAKSLIDIPGPDTFESDLLRNAMTNIDFRSLALRFVQLAGEGD